MNYLLQNNVHYLQDSNKPVLVYNNGVTSYDSCSCVIYSENHTKSNVNYIDLNPILSDNNNILINNTYNSYACTLIYNINPAFKVSDITTITSSDTITFTITINDKVYKHTYSVLPNKINTFTLHNRIYLNDTLTTFKVTYESTCGLTYKPQLDMDPSGIDDHIEKIFACILLM